LISYRMQNTFPRLF